MDDGEIHFSPDFEWVISQTPIAVGLLAGNPSRPIVTGRREEQKIGRIPNRVQE
jgi:hypothetical protein